MKRRYLAVWMLLLVGLTAGTVQAQERERDAERGRQEAERKLEEAQRQLERVLAQLRENQTREARRELEQAIAQLRAAERELRRGQFRYFWRDSLGWDFSVLRFPEGANLAVFGTGRPRIGVVVQTERNAETDSIGARLAGVTPGGPADEAGMESDDIIVEANGVSLARRGRSGENPGEKLIGIVRKLDEGDTLLVTYRRGDDSRTATVIPRTTGFGNLFAAYPLANSLLDITVPRLRMRAESLAVLAPRVERLELDEPVHVFSRILIGGWYDIELVTLNEDLGGYFGTEEGLLVVRAPSDGSLNLKSGDVILAIGGREPTSPSHAMRILRSYDEGETIRMEIMRNKRPETITATMPEKDSDWPDHR